MALPQEFETLDTRPPARSKLSNTLLAAGVVVVALIAAAAWLALPWAQDRDDEYPVLERRENGVVVERLSSLVTPRPGVTVASDPFLSYPYAFPPSNSGVGPCWDPKFTIEKMPPRAHVYRDDEVLQVPIGYSASGCSHAVVAYLGRHVEGSRRYEIQCESGLVDDCGDLRSWFFTDEVRLPASEGTILIPAEPVTADAVTVDSVPDLGGFVLCGIIVSVGDLSECGNHSSQEIRLGCPFDERGPRALLAE